MPINKLLLEKNGQSMFDEARRKTSMSSDSCYRQASIPEKNLKDPLV